MSTKLSAQCFILLSSKVVLERINVLKFFAQILQHQTAMPLSISGVHIHNQIDAILIGENQAEVYSP